MTSVSAINRRRRSIRTQLLGLLLAAAAPLVALLILALRANVEDARERGGNLVQTLADTTAAHAHDFLNNSEGLLGRIAERHRGRKLAPVSCHPLLADFRELFPQFSNLLMTDLSGQVTCTAAPALSKQALSMADANWFQRVVKENRFVVSAPLVGRITGRWISVLSYPLRDEAGQVSGAIAVGVDLVEFHPKIFGMDLPPKTVLGIVDGKGIVVASSVEPQLWVGKDLGKTALVRAMAAQSRGQTILRGPDGVERVYGFGIVTGTGWHVFAGIPKEVVFKDLPGLALRHGLTILGVLALALGIALYVARRIAAPIDAVAEAARQVSAGRTGARVAVRGAREVAEVAESFNDMLERRARAETELHHAKERLDLALEASGLALWDWDIPAGKIYVSEKWAEMIEQKPGPSVTEPEALWRLVHWNDQDRLQQVVRSALKGETPAYHAEHRVRTRSGEWKWILSRGKVVERDEHGRALRMTGTNADISERKRAEERLEYLTQYDTLTGLPNRALFRDRLALAMTRAKRNEQLLGVMLLDLDRFKAINDTLGHAMGDRVLQEVAGRITSSLRHSDTVARQGGDEFTILLEGISHVNGIATAAEKILNALSGPIKVESHELFVTASIGVTVYPFDVEDIEGLLAKADVAMYHAKQQERNTYRFYTTGLDAGASRRLSMETALRRALEREEFVLHYQPILTANGTIVAVEALLRWQHPEEGLVGPAHFLAFAEETELIAPIGEWALGAACAQNQAWQQAGLAAIPVAVKIFPRQFRQKDLVKQAGEALSRTGLDAKWLILEIAESSILHREQEGRAVLQALATLGIGLAIDNFGTGYSSLIHIAKLPVNTLKIDRSFIANLASEADSMTVVSSIITLAHSLKLRVVAKGVESEEQKHVLRLLKCDEYQGHLFAQPLPPDRLEAMLAKQSSL